MNFTGRNSRNVVLPKIDNGRNHLSKLKRQTSSTADRKPRKKGSRNKITNGVKTKAFYDPSTPLTLELKHGGQMHQVHLPTENLDKSKKYYVTFTINRRGNGSIDDEEEQPPELQYTQSIDNHVIPQVSES